MVRVKMPLRQIHGEKGRNAAFMKRREMVKRKAMELGKLCDVETMVVCFGPRGQLETWPEDRAEVYRMIERYYSAGAADNDNRRYDISTFFETHIKNLQKKVNIQRKSWLDSISAENSLLDLLLSLDKKLEIIDEKISEAKAREEEEEKERERRENVGVCNIADMGFLDDGFSLYNPLSSTRYLDDGFSLYSHLQRHHDGDIFFNGDDGHFVFDETPWPMSSVASSLLPGARAQADWSGGDEDPCNPLHPPFR